VCGCVRVSVRIKGFHFVNGREYFIQIPVKNSWRVKMAAIQIPKIALYVDVPMGTVEQYVRSRQLVHQVK
jgi:hypothetical protein